MGNSSSHHHHSHDDSAVWKNGETFHPISESALLADGSTTLSSSGRDGDPDMMKQSYRSYRSSEGSTVSTPIASSVHTNLMRSHTKRDPMKYYTVVAILGKGSMGSVAKVKKKDSAKGGSARPKFVKENHGPCYQFCNTFLPPILAKFRKQDALSGHHSHQSHHDILHHQHHNHHRHTSSWLTGSNIGKITDNGHDSTKLTEINTSTGTTETESPVQKSPSATESPTIKQPCVTISTSQVTFPESVLSNTTTSTGSGTKSIPKKNLRILRHQSSSLVTYGTRKEMYYALKSIHLERCSSQEFIEELKNEVEILKSLDHPNIVRAIETFDFRGRLFLVLELCQGGDLYTRDPYSEDDARNIVNCLLSAVGYMHTKGIVHRDLKFENICFADNTPASEVRIIDFGLSQKFAADEHLHDAVGTVYTMAPELLRGEYDAKVDVWSIGVIAFSLLSSSLPFFGPDRMAVMKKIVRGKYRFTSKRWKDVSDNAKNFVHTLLQQDPEKRPSAIDALDCTWVRNKNDLSQPLTEEEIEQFDAIQSSIQAFSGYRTLKKLALMVVAYQSTSEEVGFLRKLFDRFDLSHDGEVTLPEFHDALYEQYDYTEEELTEMFNGIDIDGTGKVHYIEFLAATVEALGAIDEERLAEAFARIDSDDSGYITVGDLKAFLGNDIPDSYIERVIDEADILHDHRVSYAEFLELWDKEADEILTISKSDVRRRRQMASSKRSQSLSANDSIVANSSIASSSNDEDFTEQDHLAELPDTSKDLSSSVRGTGKFNFMQRPVQSARHLSLDLTETRDEQASGDFNPIKKRAQSMLKLPSDQTKGQGYNPSQGSGEFYFGQRKVQSIRKLSVDQSEKPEEQVPPGLVHGTGEYYFSQRKFQSIRKVELDLQDLKNGNIDHSDFM